MAGSQPRGLRMRVAFVAMTVALVGAAVLVCGVMLAKTVRLPTELVEKDAYQHQDTWGGFLESDHSSNHLSQSDMTLLRIAQHDIKKQHSKALKSEKKAEDAYIARRKAEKLAELKKQKAEMAKEAVEAKHAPKPLPASATKEGLRRSDLRLLAVAQHEINTHHAKELAEEEKDQAAAKKIQEAKAKARAAYLAKHPLAASREAAASRAKTAKHAVSKAHGKEDTEGSWGGYLPKVSLQHKPRPHGVEAIPIPPKTAQALKAVGVDGTALQLLASAEKSIKRDTQKGLAARSRDNHAYAQLHGKKVASIFDESRADKEANDDFRAYAKEATVGLMQATKDDAHEMLNAWKK